MTGKNYWIHHAAISVANMEESIAWYHEAFGFELVSTEYVPPCRSTVATLSNGSFALEIFLHDETVPLSERRRNPDLDPMEQGTKHICFGTDDLEGMITELKEKGVKILVGPAKVGESTVYYISDNSGNPLELMQLNS